MSNIKKFTTIKKKSLYDLPHLNDLETGKVLQAPKEKTILPPSYSCRIPPELRIPLSDELETLYKIFDSLDYTMMYYHSKKQLCIFHKIKKAVENVSEHKFELDSLRGIIGVFPEAYNIEARRHAVNGTMMDTFVLEFNHLWSKKRKQEHKLIRAPKQTKTTEINTRPVLAIEFQALDLPLRRQEFRRRLMKITEIPLGELPQHYVLPSPIEIVQKKEPQKESGDRFQALLDRVRAKAQKPKPDVNKTMLGRLFLVSATVRSYFISKRKNTLLLQDVAKAVSDSYPSNMSVETAISHLKLLSEVVPQWCKIILVLTKQHLRIDSDYPFPEIKSAIQKARIN